MRYLLCLITTAALAATADVTLTVDKLVDFVRSSIQMKKPDKKLADSLHHVKLTQKLDDQTIADLQAMGAGPKTVASLKELGETSAKLPDASTAPPKAIPTVIPDPDAVEQSKIIEEARNYVMNYTRQLPNFMCLEVVRRDVDPTGTGGRWHHVDTDTIRVSYFEHHEDYQVVSVNDQPVTNKTIGQLSGAVSKGEFGSMMKEIFEPESHARFSWAYWSSLRGRLTYVFDYDIEQMYSKYRVTVAKTSSIVPAYRGRVFIDKDTKMVTKVTLAPYDIPATFPIRGIHSSVDYDFTKIGDAEFLLPVKAVVTSMRANQQLHRNDIQFSGYRRFGTETNIKFDTPEPIPDEKFKEKPLEEKKKP